MYDMIFLEREIEKERRLTLGGKHRLNPQLLTNAENRWPHVMHLGFMKP
jgi:hypothetical protein